MRPTPFAAASKPAEIPESSVYSAVQTEKRFPALDGLRGLAAVGIAVFHYLMGPAQQIPALQKAIRISEVSPLSLDIFFILSGFLIGGILLRGRERPDYYKSFYMRRACRILPVYYLWVGLFVALYLVTSRGWGMDPPQGYRGPFCLASYIFLFQNFFPVICTSTLMLAPTWTLAVEEHFYLLAPFVVRNLSARRLVQALLGVIVLAPVLRGIIFKLVMHHDEWGAKALTRFLPPCRADALAMGVLLAVAWRMPEVRGWIREKAGTIRNVTFVFFAMALFLYLMGAANVRHFRLLDMSVGRTVVECSCLCLIVYLICRPESAFGRFLCAKVMGEFGKISYALYVMHWGVLWMIYRFVLHARTGENLWLDFAVMPVALLLSIGMAQVSWHYVEAPLIRRAHGMRPPLALAARQPQVA